MIHSCCCNSLVSLLVRYVVGSSPSMTKRDAMDDGETTIANIDTEMMVERISSSRGSLEGTNDYLTIKIDDEKEFLCLSNTQCIKEKAQSHF